jgi:phosphosulfolactate synthase
MSGPDDRRLAYEMLPMQPRTAKPRSTGLTMMIDFGIGPRQQDDLLDLAADYVDSAKIAVGTSRLLERGVLMEKIRRYARRAVESYPGGQFMEYAVLCGRVDAYLEETVALGFKKLEVSDNLLSISLAEKAGLIKKAREGHGLAVLGEVGKKDGEALTAPLDDDVRACLDAGCTHVLVEAAEVFGHGRGTELAAALARLVPPERLIFELTGPWIAGTPYSGPDELLAWLVKEFGADVNVGNVLPDAVLRYESARRRLGVNAGGELPEGVLP